MQLMGRDRAWKNDTPWVYKVLPQRPALISAGNILHGVGWKFQAAKHSSWEQRLSRRVGKQDRGGACSSQASLLHSSCPLHGGDQFPQACIPWLCLPLPRWEEGAQDGQAVSLKKKQLLKKKRSKPTPASYRASQSWELSLARLQELYSKSEKNE